jgi:O-antigen/teichoic acid export membrane protein
MNIDVKKIGFFFLTLKRILKLQAHDQTTEQGLSDERYRRILLTGGSSLLVKAISVSINLFTVPLTLNYLGVERYGLWMTISSVMVLMGFADMGLGNGLLNAIAKAKGLNNKRDAQVAVSSTFFILLTISLVLLGAFLLSYPFISWYKVFNVNSAVGKIEAGPTMMALIIPLLVNMPLGVIQRIQEGNQEGFKFQLYLILGSILSFISILLCVYFKAGLPWLVFCYSIGPIIATCVNGAIMFLRKYPELRPRFSNFKMGVGKDLIRIGLVFFVLQLFTLLATASDNIVISRTLGPSSVAIYEIVKKMFLFSMITQIIIQPLWPAFGEAIEKGDMIWVKNTLKKALVLSIGVGAFITLPLLIFGKQIVSIWVGPTYSPSWSLLLGFYVFMFLSNYGGVMSTFLNSGRLIKKQVVMVGLASTSAFLLKFYLSSSIGVSGVIWATIIGYCIFYVYPSYKLAVNQFKV